MRRELYVPRQSKQSTGSGATVAPGAYRVFLVELGSFPDDRGQAQQIRDGIRDRLVMLFNLVAAQPGLPTTITVQPWLRSIPDLQARHPHARELIIYFVDNYLSGFIAPYVQSQISNRALPEPTRARLQQRHSEFSGFRPPEVGLTINEPDQGWTLCEVHIHTAYRTYPYLMNPSPQLNAMPLYRSEVGFGFGGIAYHEAMHNKLDLNMGPGWSLHESSPGVPRPGLAGSGYNGQHAPTDISLMAAHIWNPAPRQLIPTAPASGGRPAIPLPPQGPSTPGSGSTTGGQPPIDIDLDNPNPP